MIGTVASVARRGFEAHQKGELEIPAWAFTFIVITALFFPALSFIIRYTYGSVIGTLLMVESPSATLYVPVPKNDDPDAPLQDTEKAETELMMVKEAPITSSIFKAEKHLVARAGSMARFRGISIAVFHNVVMWIQAQLFVRLLPDFLGRRAIAIVLSQVIVAQISTGWTHIVISEPSSKYWWQRIPRFSTWKKVAGPTLVLSLAEQVAEYMPVYLARAWGLLDLNFAEVDDYSHLGKKVVVVCALGLATTFLVVIPAKVTLTRVQASLLSQEEETIVPFDRSFGGRVVPEVLGGSGVVGMLDAWKTFGFHSRITLIKLCAKVIAMQCLVLFLWLVVTIGFVIITPDLRQSVTSGMTHG